MAASCCFTTAVLAPPRRPQYDAESTRRPPSRKSRSSSVPPKRRARVPLPLSVPPSAVPEDDTEPGWGSGERTTPRPEAEGIIDPDAASQVFTLAFPTPTVEKSPTPSKPSVPLFGVSESFSEYASDSISVAPSVVSPPRTPNPAEVKKRADELRQKRREARNKTYAYNVKMKDLAVRRDMEGCLSLLDEMRDAGIQADCYTYSTILSCCAKTRATETAFTLYGRMLAERVRLDEHLLITMMNIAGRALPPNLEFLRALFHQAPSPSRVLCNVFIGGLANAGQVDDVDNVLRYMKMRQLGSDGYTASGVTKAYVRAGFTDEANRRLRSMQNEGIRIPTTAYNTIIAAFAAEGRTALAMKLFNILGSKRRTQVSYNVMITAYAHGRKTDIEDAFNLFDAMLQEGLHKGDRYTMHALMKVCLASSDGHVAFKTYEAFSSEKAGPNWLPNQVSYRLAFQAAAVSRDMEAIETVYRDVVKNGAKLRRDAAGMSIAAIIRCGNLKLALTFVRKYLAIDNEKDEVPLFFEAIETSFSRLRGPAMLSQAGNVEADEVVADLVKAWDIVSENEDETR